MPDPRPIGVFDSGVGGLTVVRALIDDLPHESIVYFGDTGRYPYGPRPLEEITGFAVQIALHLMEQNVKVLVVACNSATAAGLDAVVEAVPVPVVGVVAPAVRSAVRATRNGRVGLIGTVATVSSGAYERAFRTILGPERGGVQVVSHACPRFVEFVERGDTTSPELLRVAEEYLAPLSDADIDTLILGCTHYPLLRGAIHHVMGPEVLLLSSAEETANDVYEELSRRGMLSPTSARPAYRFESSGDPGRFAELGRIFLGPEVRGAQHVALEPAVGA